MEHSKNLSQQTRKEPITPYYYPLSLHMFRDHSLTLIDSEMDEICRAVDRVRKTDYESLRSLLEQMLAVAECADETGYVTDTGFVDLDELHTKVRDALRINP